MAVMRDTDWSRALATRLPRDYGDKIAEFVRIAYSSGTNIYPPKDRIYAALELTPLAETKVVIVGQDPYPQPGKAQGLSFSYPKDFRVPRADSITNIQTELAAQGFDKRDSDLTGWASQGVLLLNAVLTVPEFKSNGHAGKIWEPFTDEVIKIASDDQRPKVFILWGANARNKKALVNADRHLVLESAHPSPMSASRGFFGSRFFEKANDFLVTNGQQPIDWSR
jgi:uracil-DNA glycosylase